MADALGSAEEALRNNDVLGAERALSSAWPSPKQMPGGALYLLANVRVRQQRAAEAEELLRAAIAAEPNVVRHRAALAQMQSARGDHIGAVDTYAEALRIDMNTPGLMGDYAKACYAVGRYDEGEKAARHWLKTEPSPQAWDTLSCVLREQGKGADALAAADEALRLAPDNAGAQHSRGAALLALKRPQEALDVFNALMGRGVRAPVIWLNRGNALVALNRRADAVAVFAEGAQLWPNDAKLSQALARSRA